MLAADSTAVTNILNAITTVESTRKVEESANFDKSGWANWS